MTVTAEYPLAKSLNALRELIAESACWQALVKDQQAPWARIKTLADADPDNRVAALKRIIGDTLYEDERFREALQAPFILVRHEQGATYLRESPDVFRKQHLLRMVIELPVPREYAKYDVEAIWNATIDFMNKVGRIMHEMQTVNIAGTADRLQMELVTMGPIGAVEPASSNGEWVRTVEFMIQTKC